MVEGRKKPISSLRQSTFDIHSKREAEVVDNFVKTTSSRFVTNNEAFWRHLSPVGASI